MTLPPTDTGSGVAGPTNDGWRLVLVILAGLLAMTLVLTPQRPVRRH